MADYLTRKQVAERLQISRETLRILRQRDFPEPIHISARKMLWKSEDVEKWMETR